MAKAVLHLLGILGIFLYYELLFILLVLKCLLTPLLKGIAPKYRIVCFRELDGKKM